MKVFVADDSDSFILRFVRMLSKIDGITVAGQAKDVQTAIMDIEKLAPDLAMLDIRMPGGSGIDVLQHIKKISPSIVVIILTNYPYPEYREKCMQQGADYFFVKSKELERVFEILKDMAASAIWGKSSMGEVSPKH